MVNATTEDVLHTAPLSGPRQSIDRAEASALLVALLWAEDTGSHVKIWSDSRSSVDIATGVLATGTLGGVSKNGDLWQQFLEAVLRTPHLTKAMQWIPSHQADDSDDPFLAWCRRWNDQADRAAVMTNQQRGVQYDRCLGDIRYSLATWKRELHLLRGFYLSAAREAGAVSTAQPQTLTADEVLDTLQPATVDSLIDHTPLGAMAYQFHDSKQPAGFTRRLLDALIEFDQPDGDVWMITDVELRCLLANEEHFGFPVWNSSSKGWEFRAYSLHFERYCAHPEGHLWCRS